MFNTLISAADLKQLQNADDLVIMDCRFDLMDVDKGRQLYQASHLPGAFYLDLDNDLSSPVTVATGRHPLPDFDRLSRILNTCGVAPETQVVVYDDCAGAMASRAWWLLKLLGHNQVAVLDGGFPAWQRAAGDLESGIPEPRAGQFTARIDQGMILPLEQVADHPDRGLLVDARTAERYRGEQEPIDPVAGHIPGAINRPLQLNLDSNGCFKPVSQLYQEWQSLLAGTAPQEVVHYCGSGVTACHNLLAMEHAGLTGSRIYPGSWSEWIRDETRPVATTGSN